MRPFKATGADGVAVDSDRLLAEPSVYLFMSASCQPCRLVAADLRDRWESARGMRLMAVLEDEAEAEALGLPSGLQVLYQSNRVVSEAFRNSGVPHAFAVDRGGVVVATSGVQGVGGLKRLDDALEKGGEAAPRQVSIPS